MTKEETMAKAIGAKGAVPGEPDKIMWYIDGDKWATALGLAPRLSEADQARARSTISGAGYTVVESK